MLRGPRSLTSRKDAGGGGGGEAPAASALPRGFAFASLRGQASPLMWARPAESALLPRPRPADETAGGGPQGGWRPGPPSPVGERPPSPPAAARTRSPLAQSPRWESGGGAAASREADPASACGRQEGRLRLARGSPRATSVDPPGWAAGGGARGSPAVGPGPERSGAMGAWGSHPPSEAAAGTLDAARPLQGGHALSAPAAPSDPQDWDQGPPHSPTSPIERPRSFEEDLQELRASSDPLAQDLVRALESVGRFAFHLLSNHQQLNKRLHRLEAQHQDRVSHLLAENQRLQEAIQELESRHKASQAQQAGPQRSAPQPSTSEGLQTPPGKVFPVQIRTAGKTGGCERQFVQDVSKLLSHQGVSLKVEESTETSKHLLLVFCPIASRFNTNIESAFQGFSGEQKVLLVAMHYLHKDHTGLFRDARQQVPHPSVVRTVHTRYTLQEGFYPCETNRRAVADVADAIKGMGEDP